MVENIILTQEQRDAGLDTREDEDFVYLVDVALGETVAVFSSSGPTATEIRKEADRYLHQRASKGGD